MNQEINDFPKIQCPFVRKEDAKGNYVCVNEITEGYAWVFEDPDVICSEKLDGTNVSILIQNGQITAIFNRTERIPFFSKGKRFIIEGLLNSWERGYMDMLPDGQHFGELIGPKVQSNHYKLKEHLWIPFESYCQKRLRYKTWGEYPKDFNTISEWFKTGLISLYGLQTGDKQGWVEGVMFYNPKTGMRAKLRRDCFDWYYEDPNNKPHKYNEDDARKE